MNPITIATYKDYDDTPLLILVDLQREYLCLERRLGLRDPDRAISNCSRLVSWARANRIPIAFVRWTQPGKLFSKSNNLSGWIDGCAPTGSDMVFERAWPSCYASPEFARMMDDGAGQNAIIAGFTGSMACLTTIIEGVPRKHRFTFVSDASLSHELGSNSQSEAHDMATKMISQFADVTDTATVVRTRCAFQVLRNQITVANYVSE